MMVFAGMLLVGLGRAKAVMEAHEQFTLTPVLIGKLVAGRRGSRLRSRSRCVLL
jgi:hypothetical protein